MKLILLFFMTLSTAQAGGSKVICSLKQSKDVIAIAEKHSSYDKNRHCTVSCMLSLVCNRQEVLLIGYLKEFRDFFGPGEADTEDLKANRLGIDLAKRGRARSNQECLEQCDLYYSRR
jgi:hypothetical protein